MGPDEEEPICPLCGGNTALTECALGICRSAAPEFIYQVCELVRVVIAAQGLPQWPTWLRALGAPYGIRAGDFGTEVITLREFLEDLVDAVRLVPGSTLQELPLAPGLYGDVALFQRGNSVTVRSWDPAWVPIEDDSLA
jgi:hypothetical protein